MKKPRLREVGSLARVMRKSINRCPQHTWLRYGALARGVVSTLRTERPRYSVAPLGPLMGNGRLSVGPRSSLSLHCRTN